MMAIKQVMGFETATMVQHQMLSRMPIENDLMVKAKTGTGKTTAFLVPAIEALLREYEKDPSREHKGRTVGCLVVSPTRELAQQIAAEAEKLTRFHRWNVQLLVGGESSGGQLRRLRSMRSDIVIGTPGRLKDFLTNQESFKDQISRTKMLILDEADMLLDMGFRGELDAITAQLPADRQTFLVSATLDKNVKSLAATVFSRGFDMIDCVGKDEANTHANVKQEYVHASPAQQLPLTIDLIESHIAQCRAEGRGSKIVVFLPTVKAADLYDDVLQQVVSRRGRDTVNVTLLHGKIRQERRVRMSDRFRKFPVTVGNTSILVTTDVSARGVDYPNVSMVIQAGIPSHTESYIHRLGRTGRAGKPGEGVALLSSLELPFLNNIRGVPITKSEKYTPDYINDVCGFQNDTLKHLGASWEGAMQRTDPEMVRDAYVSMLAFYGAHTELIGQPHGREIVDSLADFVTPFNAPVPQIPRVLMQSLRLDKGPRRSMQQGGGAGYRRAGPRDDGEFGSRFGSRDGGDRSRRFGSRDGGDRPRQFGSRDGGDRPRQFGSRNSSGNNRSFGQNSRGPAWGGRGKVSKPSFKSDDRPRFGDGHSFD